MVQVWVASFVFKIWLQPKSNLNPFLHFLEASFMGKNMLNYVWELQLYINTTKYDTVVVILGGKVRVAVICRI